MTLLSILSPLWYSQDASARANFVHSILAAKLFNKSEGMTKQIQQFLFSLSNCLWAGCFYAEP